MFASNKCYRTALSPVAAAGVIMLSVFASVALCTMFKKEIGCATRSIRRFGEKCADTMEDCAKSMCRCDCED